jgi:hypothetical protein
LLVVVESFEPRPGVGGEGGPVFAMDERVVQEEFEPRMGRAGVDSALAAGKAVGRKFTIDLLQHAAPA